MEELGHATLSITRKCIPYQSSRPGNTNQMDRRVCACAPVQTDGVHLLRDKPCEPSQIGIVRSKQNGNMMSNSNRCLNSG